MLRDYWQCFKTVCVILKNLVKQHLAQFRAEEDLLGRLKKWYQKQQADKKKNTVQS